MTFKAYSKQFLIISAMVIISTIGVNIYLNEFGLIGNQKNKDIRIYADEKTSKYLLSFNYIPNNFNGILVGPSLSDQMMDTKKLSDNYEIYNLSMDGGNISELKYAIDNVLKYGNIKLFIISLDPYITKNSGTKSSQINPKEYYSTFGSIFTAKYYLKKYRDIKKGDKSIYYDSYWGYTDNEYQKQLKELTSKYEYRLDTNFAKIDRIEHKSLEDFKQKILKKKIHGKTIETWSKKLSNGDIETIKEILEL